MSQARRKRSQAKQDKNIAVPLLLTLLFWVAYACYFALFFHWSKTSQDIARPFYWIFAIFMIGNAAVPAYFPYSIDDVPAARSFHHRFVAAILSLGLLIGALWCFYEWLGSSDTSLDLGTKLNCLAFVVMFVVVVGVSYCSFVLLISFGDRHSWDDFFPHWLVFNVLVAAIPAISALLKWPPLTIGYWFLDAVGMLYVYVLAGSAVTQYRELRPSFEQCAEERAEARKQARREANLRAQKERQRRWEQSEEGKKAKADEQRARQEEQERYRQQQTAQLASKRAKQLEEERQKRQRAKEQWRLKRELEQTEKQLAAEKEIEERPHVAAAEKRRLLALFAEHVEYVRKATPIDEFRKHLEQNLGTSQESSTIIMNAAMMADKLLKTAARERVRAEFIARKDILADTYPLPMFEEDLLSMLNDFAPLDDFRKASDSLIETITNMAERLRPEYESRVSREKEAEERRRTEEQQRATEEKARKEREEAERAAREHETKIRAEISECVRAFAEGSELSEEEMQQEIELRMSRWAETDGRPRNAI